MNEQMRVVDRQPDPKGSSFLTLDEVAARLRVEKSWIYQHRHAKTLPFPVKKVGQYLRFRRADIDKFMDEE